MKNFNIDFMSYAGSYMAIAKKTDKDSIISKNLMLRSLHGMSKNKNCWDICEFIPDFSDNNIESEIGYFKSEIISKNKKIRVSFANKDCIVVNIENCNLCIDFMFKSANDYVLKSANHSYVLNSYKTSTKYIVSFRNVSDVSVKEDKMYVYADNGYIFIKETTSNIDCPFDGIANFELFEKEMEEAFIKFTSTFPKNVNWNETLKYAQYVIWSSIVKPRWMIKHNMILTSNYKFTCAWGFDNLFTLIGLMEYQPKLAKEQLQNFIDSQDEFGMLPGSIDDSTYRFNFAKPPGQGVFLKKTMKKDFWKIEDKRRIYGFLGRLTKCWLDKKDINHDGICEYFHGNESCQDNSTQFDNLMPVDSAELFAYMLANIDVLIMLAQEIGDEDGCLYWRNLLSKQKKHIPYFFDGLSPISRYTETKEIINSKSILPNMILLANNHLNNDQKNRIIRKIEKEYLGICGISTEALNSPKYMDDGYFRGSVFPYEMLLVDAIAESGEEKLAKDIANLYCNCFKKQGSYECFDSKTGIGQRECSYTSTSALFLYLFYKYLN